MPKHWIQTAINPKNRGKLRRRLHVKKGHKIPKSKLKAASRKPGSLGKEARMALTLRKINK